jgi:hypothetical protein
VVLDVLKKELSRDKMKYIVVATFALAAANAAANPQTENAPPKPTNMPKLGGAPIPFGPAPTGCNSYEILIGESAEH